VINHDLLPLTSSAWPGRSTRFSAAGKATTSHNETTTKCHALSCGRFAPSKDMTGQKLVVAAAKRKDVIHGAGWSCQMITLNAIPITRAVVPAQSHGPTSVVSATARRVYHKLATPRSPITSGTTNTLVNRLLIRSKPHNRHHQQARNTAVSVCATMLHSGNILILVATRLATRGCALSSCCGKLYGFEKKQRLRLLYRQSRPMFP